MKYSHSLIYPCNHAPDELFLSRDVPMKVVNPEDRGYRQIIEYRYYKETEGIYKIKVSFHCDKCMANQKKKYKGGYRNSCQSPEPC